MFIHNSKNINDNINKLENFDYCKRYIVINPTDQVNLYEITVVNISSTTGRSRVGIFSNSQRYQLMYVYHCIGNPFNSIFIDRDNIKNNINLDSHIMVKGVSYGNHLYDLNKQRFNELRVSTSYNDLADDIINFEKIPYIKYYNIEQHVIAEERDKKELFRGNFFLKDKVYNLESNPSYMIKLGDLIDENTIIMVFNKENFNKFNSSNPRYLNGDIDDILCNESIILLVGPVTDFILGFMYNEMDFCYDSIDGLSRIKYKTNHKLPNKLYQEQIYGNLLSTFQNDMDYLSSLMKWNYRIFVYCRLGFVAIRLISYDKVSNRRIEKNYSFNINRTREKQHSDSIGWYNYIYGNVPAV